MSHQRSHIVQKLLLDVTVNVTGGHASQYAVFEKLRTWLEQDFLPRLEAAFDNMQLPPHQVMRLETLELDLGQLLEGEMAQVPTATELQGLVGKSIEKWANESGHDPSQSLGEQKNSVVEALVFFLESGRLPWWHSPIPSSMAQWEQELVKAFQTGAFAAGKLATALRQMTARQRLFRQFSKGFIATVLEAVFAVQKSASLEMQAFAAKSLKKKQRSPMAWEAVFGWLSQTSKPLQLAHFVAEFKSPTPGSTSGLVAQTLAASSQQLEEIYLQNAGLVLLHPFLKMLFEKLEVAKNGQITKPDKALQLLHFLATGRTLGPEYDLVLNKLLCGLPPSAFVENIARLTKIELTECENLLKAVIGHWSALGDTSTEGLRGTFLWREGKLSRKQDGSWLLQVEQRTVDVLLDRLPWGIGMVKLPWMPEILWVEWV